AGDFSFRLRGADGIPGTADDGLLRDPLRKGTCTRANREACFPGNVIPADRITADGRALAKAYATMTRLASTYSDTPTANNAILELNSPFDFREDILRLDYQIDMAHSIAARYLHDRSDSRNVARPPSFLSIPRSASSGMLSHTWTLRSTLINETRYNVYN